MEQALSEFTSEVLGKKDPRPGMAIDDADTFFGMPDIFNQVEEAQYPTQCANGCLALRVPDPPVYAPPAIVNISKDGRIAAVGGKDVELFLWSTETGELLSTLRGHETSWTGSNDNTFFVTTQEDSKVVVWDQQKIQQRMLLGHPDEALTCCSISFDDEYVVVGSAEGSIYSWDVDSGMDNREYFYGHDGPVATAMCFRMPDGTHIIISCGKEDHRIVVWDLEMTKQLYSLEVVELDQAKNLCYHINKEHIQVLVWCTDSVIYPNLVFIDPLSGNRHSVHCHNGEIRHAAFMKKTSFIVSSGSDGKVIIWDTETMEVCRVLEGHTGPVLSCGVNEMGTQIVSAGEDCTIRVWNAEDGKPIRMMLAKNDPVRYCQYAKNPIETKIITCDTVGRVHVWSTVVEVLSSMLRRFADELSCVTASSDNKFIAAGCNNGRVMLWDTKTRGNVWEYSHHTGRVEAIAFNTLREYIVTSGADGRVVVIDAETGKQYKLFIVGSEPVTQISFSPDDDRIAGVSDGNIVVFKTEQSDWSPALTLKTGVSKVVTLVWSPNSKTIIGGCADGSIMVWSASTGAIFAALNGDAAITCLSIDLVGKVLAVGNVLGRTILYILETSEQLSELRSNAAPVSQVIFNQSTTRLTTVCSRQAIVWDLGTGAQLRAFDFVVDKGHGFFKSVPDPIRTTYYHWGTVLFDHESETAAFDLVPFEDPTLLRSYYHSDVRGIMSGNTSSRRIVMWSGADNPTPDKFHTAHDAITSCHFSPDDRLLAVGTQDGSMVVYDAERNDTLEVIQAHHNGPCKCVRMSNDGKHILTCGSDAQVIIWDWREREPVHHYYAHTVGVNCCDMALNGTRLASGDESGIIYAFDHETTDIIMSLKPAHEKSVVSLSISSDGSTLVSIGDEGQVYLWHVDMGSLLTAVDSFIIAKPLACAFSADDSKLAITDSIGDVVVWNILAGCQWYLIKEAHAGAAVACAWSFNGRNLATAGLDGNVALWDAESGAPQLKLAVKSGHFTTCALSPSSTFLASGSVSGTLAINNVPSHLRLAPEPAFLYSWLDMYEYKEMAVLLKRLFQEWPYLYNMQEAQGWSLTSNAVANGNAKVTSILMEALEELPDCAVGLMGAVPCPQVVRIILQDEDEQHKLGSSSFGAGIQSLAKRLLSIKTGSFVKKPPIYPDDMREDSFAPPALSPQDLKANPAFAGAANRKKLRGKGNKIVPMNDEDSDVDQSGDMSLIKRAKSFNAQAVRSESVQISFERRPFDGTEMTNNSVLAMALNSHSSKCVQAVVDIITKKKVSWGSYHAIIDMIPALAQRYPFMCYRMLAEMDLQHLGMLELPTGLMKKNSDIMYRTAPVFTNIRELWSTIIKQDKVLDEEEEAHQPYARVQARMVRLPYACALGPDSLLQSLVESDVPVQAYGSPTIRAVVLHKWDLYGRRYMLFRSLTYLSYTLVLTVFAILFSKENHSLTLPEYWESGPQGRFHIISTGYLVVQALWYLYMEARQMFAIKLTVYWKSWWNSLDILSPLMMVAVGVLQLTRTGTQPYRDDRAVGPMIAFLLMLTYFKLFFYALAFERTGPIVHMLFQLCLAVRDWTVLLFMNIVAFGTALQVLAQFTNADDEHKNFGRSIFTLWQALFMHFDLHAFLDEGAWPEVSIVIWCLWLFISLIILLNMLIVMMSDTYREVRHKEQDTFLRGRAEHVVETETLMTDKERERWSFVPPYLHLLVQVRRESLAPNSLLARLEHLELYLHSMHQGLMDLVCEVSQLQGGTFGWRKAQRPPDPLLGAEDSKHSMALDKLTSPHPSSTALAPRPSDQSHGHGPPHMTRQEQLEVLQFMLQRVHDSESQLPAVLRQVERLERSVVLQEQRMEAMGLIMQSIEQLLRNQRPPTIKVAAPPLRRRRAGAVSEAELEVEVRRLLGGGGPPPSTTPPLAPGGKANARESASASNNAAAADMIKALREGGLRGSAPGGIGRKGGSRPGSASAAGGGAATAAAASRISRPMSAGSHAGAGGGVSDTARAASPLPPAAVGLRRRAHGGKNAHAGGGGAGEVVGGGVVPTPTSPTTLAQTPAPAASSRAAAAGARAADAQGRLSRPASGGSNASGRVAHTGPVPPTTPPHPPTSSTSAPAATQQPRPRSGGSNRITPLPGGPVSHTHTGEGGAALPASTQPHTGPHTAEGGTAFPPSRLSLTGEGKPVFGPSRTSLAGEGGPPLPTSARQSLAGSAAFPSNRNSLTGEGGGPPFPTSRQLPPLSGGSRPASSAAVAAPVSPPSRAFSRARSSRGGVPLAHSGSMASSMGSVEAGEGGGLEAGGGADRGSGGGGVNDSGGVGARRPSGVSTSGVRVSRDGSGAASGGLGGAGGGGVRRPQSAGSAAGVRKSGDGSGGVRASPSLAAGLQPLEMSEDSYPVWDPRPLMAHMPVDPFAGAVVPHGDGEGGKGEVMLEGREGVQAAGLGQPGARAFSLPGESEDRHQDTPSQGGASSSTAAAAAATAAPAGARASGNSGSSSGYTELPRKPQALRKGRIAVIPEQPSMEMQAQQSFFAAQLARQQQQQQQPQE